MLVLSRAPGEWIKIGEDVWICVLSIRPDGRIRLGLEAPRGVPIVRDELLSFAERRGPLETDDPRRDNW
jgi:carbon storage regulator